MLYHKDALDDALLMTDHGLCDYCGKWGRVGLTVDPYVAELEGREEYRWFHNDCVQDCWYDT